VEILGRSLTLVTLGQHSEQLRHLPSMTEHSHLGFGQRQRRCHKTWFIPASRRLQSPISSVCTGLPARDLRPCSGNVVARFAFRNIPSTTTSRTHHHPITAQPIAFRMVTFPQSLASSERIASVTYVVIEIVRRGCASFPFLSMSCGLHRCGDTVHQLFITKWKARRLCRNAQEALLHKPESKHEFENSKTGSVTNVWLDYHTAVLAILTSYVGHSQLPSNFTLSSFLDMFSVLRCLLLQASSDSLHEPLYSQFPRFNISLNLNRRQR
jgi:hypothetical protein